MRFVGAVVFAAAVLLLLASPATAQTVAPTTENPLVACAKIQPASVFVGEVTDIENGLVTFEITKLRGGEGEPGSLVDVEYPDRYNPRKLKVGESYLVSATRSGEQLQSVVPTAQLKACGQNTLHADGTPVDTSTLAGTREKLPRLLKLAGVVILGSLIGLIIIGRLFNRRSAFH